MWIVLDLDGPISALVEIEISRLIRQNSSCKMNMFLTKSLLLCTLAAAFSERAGQCTDDTKQIEEGMGGSNQELGWTLTASKTQYGAGEKIKITLGHKQSGSKFKGLLLYANTPDGKHPGAWDTPSGFIGLDDQCKTLGGAKSTLSHNSDSEQSGMEFTWTAPSGGAGNIEIRGLIVTKDATTWQQFKPLALKGPGGKSSGTNGTNGTTSNTTKTPSGNFASSNSYNSVSAVLGAAAMFFF